MLGLVVMMHTYNSSYLGGRDWEDHDLSPTRIKSYQDPISINKPGKVVHNSNSSNVGSKGQKIMM
jgi:hypothetical protein